MNSKPKFPIKNNKHIIVNEQKPKRPKTTK